MLISLSRKGLGRFARGSAALGLAMAVGCNAGTYTPPYAASAAASTAPGSTTPGGGGGGGGGSTPTPPSPPVSTPGSAAKLLLDCDRNGKIDAADDKDKDKWDTTRGAVFGWNHDDDDGNHQMDGEDSILNGPDDRRNMARVVIAQVTGSQPQQVKVTVTPASAPVRVYREDQGKMSELISPGSSMSAQIPGAAVTAAEVNLWIEGTGPRSKTWDGMITVAIEIAGLTPDKDQAKLRLAPHIYVDNTRPAERVFAMRIDQGATANTPFWNAMKTGLAAQNVQLSEVDQTKYGHDRWVQDSMQLGYQGYQQGGQQVVVYEFNQLERKGNGGLFDLIPDELLAKNQGMTYAGSGAADGCNFGGNLEVIPPHKVGTTNFPFGRIVRGGGDAGSVDGKKFSRHMNKEEVDYLDGQGVQGPSFEISSEWLAVGHIDEYMLPAAAPKAAAGTRPFRILWASPSLARNALRALVTKGAGATKVYVGRKAETTVADIMNDAALMTFNDQVQQRLDSAKQVLMTTCGFTAADFVEFPVYYEISAYQGVNFGISQNPGCQNCIPINDTLYIPDPEGPKDGGKDVWKTQMDASLAAIGLKAVYVDVFESYHELMGEAHCGSNVIYKAYDTPWWKQ